MDQPIVKPRREEATVRLGGALAIPAVLRRLGADPAEVFAAAGVDLTRFDEPDNLMSYAARGRLLSHCVTQTGCQHFGLLVGQEVSLHSLGLVGLLVKYSPDVGTALDSLARHFGLHTSGAMVGLKVNGDTAVLSYDVCQPQVDATGQIGDFAVSCGLNIMRSLRGPDWAPAETLFAHRRPQDVGPYRRLFGASLRFDAEHNALVFAASELNQRLAADDPRVRQLLQDQIDAIEARLDDDLASKVRGALRTGLLTGRASANQIAAIFSIHSRTLHRRLLAFGTTFQELVDEGRFEIAKQMLENSRSQVHVIAAALDYADASAFTRAFRRWSGTTPALWRAQRDPST